MCVRSLVGISDNVNGSATPEHEGDRRTFLAGRWAPTGADADAGPGTPRRR